MLCEMCAALVGAGSKALMCLSALVVGASISKMSKNNVGVGDFVETCITGEQEGGT